MDLIYILIVLYFWLGVGVHNAIKHYPDYDDAALIIEIMFWPLFLIVISFMRKDKVGR